VRRFIFFFFLMRVQGAATATATVGNQCNFHLVDLAIGVERSKARDKGVETSPVGVKVNVRKKGDFGSENSNVLGPIIIVSLARLNNGLYCVKQVKQGV
jgi:hypothetical protein